MAQSSSPFVLKDVSLTLVLEDDLVGVPVEYRCQLQRAELVPAAGGGGGNTYETFCDTFTSGSSSSTWTLELSHFQAWGDIEDLSNFLFDHEGEVADFVLSPMGGTPSATSPAFEGKVTLVSGPIGGTANQYAQATVSLPCTSKPTKLVAAAA